ncbi:MAG: PAS domain-containing protein [Candidatus Aenigmarchaeota archaeon]|nr:PAS domain-containing protein [Candidatus Aenigmarchaeota archaeon]
MKNENQKQEQIESKDTKPNKATDILSILTSESAARGKALLFKEKEEKKARKIGFFITIVSGIAFTTTVVIYILPSFDFFTRQIFFQFLIFTFLLLNLYHLFVFKRLVKRNTKIALDISYTIIILILILLAQCPGSISSPFFLLYVPALIVASFLIRPSFTFIILIFEILASVIFILTNPRGQEFFTQSPNTSISEMVILGGIAFLSYFLGEKYFSLKGKKQEIEQIVNGLRLDNAKVEAILQSLGDGVFVVDQEKKIVFINQTALSMVKQNINTPLGKYYSNIFQILREEKPISYETDCPIQQAISENRSIQKDDLQLVIGNKRMFIALYTAPVKAPGGGVIGGLGVIRDITKEKEMERMKYEFISIASHELSAPVVALEGQLSMIVEDVEGKLDKKTRHSLLEDAYQSSIRLATLVKDLLNVSRIEQGRLPFNPKVVDLREIIQSAIDNQQIKAKEAKLNLEYKKPSKPFKVWADPDRIGEVVTNLITNAIKFTSKGSITIENSEEKGYVKTVVSDTGIGISKEHIPHLFQRFHQVDTSKKGQGTGLGLYICKKIVEKLGGKIWVESEVRKGSKFIFTLPKTKKSE